MARVKLDKIAFKRGRDDRLLIAAGRRLNVYKDDGVTPATGYTTQAGGTAVTYPLVADRNGRYEAWYPPADYWIEDVANGALTYWPAVSASDLGGRELDDGYAEIIGNVAITSTTAVDVGGLSISPILSGLRPVKVIFDANGVRNATASGAWVIDIYDVTAGAVVADVAHTVNAANEQIPCHRERVLVGLPAGARTFKIRARVGSGTCTIFAGATTPTFIEAIEV